MMDVEEDKQESFKKNKNNGNATAWVQLPQHWDIKDESCLLHRERFELDIVNKIGEGNYGRVYRACIVDKKQQQQQENKKPCRYAAKVQTLETYDGGSSALERFKEECAVTDLASRLEIGPKLIDHWDCGAKRTPGSSSLDGLVSVAVGVIVMDLVEHDEWDVTKFHPRPEYAAMIVPAVRKLHKVGWRHGDLHEGNMLISKDHKRVWIIDFSRAKRLRPSDTRYNVGSDLARSSNSATEEVWNYALKQGWFTDKDSLTLDEAHDIEAIYWTCMSPKRWMYRFKPVAVVQTKVASQGKAMDACGALGEILDFKGKSKEEEDDAKLPRLPLYLDAIMARIAAARGAVHCGMLTVFASWKKEEAKELESARVVKTNYPYDTLTLLPQLLQQRKKQPLPDRIVVNVDVIFGQWDACANNQGSNWFGWLLGANDDERLMACHDQLVKASNNNINGGALPFHTSFLIINFRNKTIDYQDPHGKQAPWLPMLQKTVLARLGEELGASVGLDKFVLRTLEYGLERPFADLYFEGNVFAGGTSLWWASLTLYLYLACPNVSTAEVEKELAQHEGLELADLLKKWVHWLQAYQQGVPSIQAVVDRLESQLLSLTPSDIRQAWYTLLVQGNSDKALAFVHG